MRDKELSLALFSASEIFSIEGAKRIFWRGQLAQFAKEDAQNGASASALQMNLWRWSEDDSVHYADVFSSHFRYQQAAGQPSEQIKSSEHTAGFEVPIEQRRSQFGRVVPPQDHDRPTQTEILYLLDVIARWDIQAQGQYTAKKLETKVRQLISDGEKTPFKLFGLGIGKLGEDSAVSDGTWNNWCSKARRLHDNSR